MYLIVFLVRVILIRMLSWGVSKWRGVNQWAITDRLHY